jgi:hypothetical protein
MCACRSKHANCGVAFGSRLTEVASQMLANPEVVFRSTEGGASASTTWVARFSSTYLHGRKTRGHPEALSEGFREIPRRAGGPAGPTASGRRRGWGRLGGDARRRTAERRSRAWARSLWKRPERPPLCGRRVVRRVSLYCIPTRRRFEMTASGCGLDGNVDRKGKTPWGGKWPAFFRPCCSRIGLAWGVSFRAA